MTDPNCIFCKIVAGEIPSHKIYEDDDFFAFLEVNPIRLGHSLIVPKDHYDNVYEMPKELYCGLMELGRFLAPSIRIATGANKISLAVAGLDLNHAHLHLLPVNSAADLNFQNQSPAKSEELAEMAEKIVARIAAL